MLKLEYMGLNAELMLKKLGSRMRNTLGFMKVWGNAVAKQARSNARAKGGRSFWQKVARNVRLHSVTGHSAIVEADAKGKFKQTGGTIRPKNKKALTIPVADEAKGKSAADFESGGRKLFVLPSKKGETVGVLGYREDDGDFHGLFLLRRSVFQKKDPWFPSRRRCTMLGLREAQLFLNREVKSV